MPKKSRITVLLGAGSTIDIGGPSTAVITEQIRNLYIYRNGIEESAIKTIKEVANKLEQLYGVGEFNFEDIYHVLDQIDSYGEYFSGRNTTLKQFKPALTAFVKPKENERIFDGGYSLVAQKLMIKKIKELVAKYELQLNKNENQNYSWYSRFWEKLVATNFCDITTLNYDRCIENIIEYTDGFDRPVLGVSKFNPKILEKTDKSRIMHLHGSINYGYPRDHDILEKYSYHELVKYQNYLDDRITSAMRQPKKDQTNERVEIGPLITGLNKTAKITSIPYSFYNAELIKNIYKNDCLLIIGYSFGDYYINENLLKFMHFNSPAAKLVIIDNLDQKRWDKNTKNLADNAYQGLNQFLGMLSIRGKTYIELNKNSIKTSNGTIINYLNGFKSAVENNCEEIISFLNS